VQVSRLDGNKLSAPFEFLFAIGEIAASAERETWLIVTVPTPIMAAAVTGLGALHGLARAGIFNRRRGLESLLPGELMTWLTAAEGQIKCGEFAGIFDGPNGVPYFAIDSRSILRPVHTFEKFHFSPFFGPRFSHSRFLSSNLPFVEAFSEGQGLNWTSQSREEICFVGSPRLRLDFVAKEFSVEGVHGCADDVLRVRGHHETSESPHFLSQLVKTLSPHTDEVSAQIAIFDGASAYQRQSNYVSATANIVILDRWEARSSDAVAGLLASRSRRAGEKFVPRGINIPNGIEFMAWRSK
jgi:hypothetical protein